MKNTRDTLRAISGSLPDITALASNQASRREAVAAISTQIRGAAGQMDAPEIERGIAEDREIVDIDTSLIDDTPWRDRQKLSIDDADFQLLIKSINDHGQITAVALRRKGDRYDVVFGHRRVHACHVLGRPVRAIIMERDDRTLVMAMLIENQARKDLSAIEKAQAYQRILESRLLDRGALAEVLGVSDRQIINVLSLNRLPDTILGSLGDARSLALNVGMRLVAALQKLEMPLPEDTFAELVAMKGDGNARARYLISRIDSASRAAAIDQSVAIKDENGRRYARLSRSGPQLVLRFQPGLDPEVIRALAERIPDLYEELARARKPNRTHMTDSSVA